MAQFFTGHYGTRRVCTVPFQQNGTLIFRAFRWKREKRNTSEGYSIGKDHSICFFTEITGFSSLYYVSKTVRALWLVNCTGRTVEKVESSPDAVSFAYQNLLQRKFWKLLWKHLHSEKTFWETKAKRTGSYKIQTRFFRSFRNWKRPRPRASHKSETWQFSLCRKVEKSNSEWKRFKEFCRELACEYSRLSSLPNPNPNPFLSSLVY